MDLPDSFNADGDFQEKEKWQRAKPFIKCDVCKLAVKYIVKSRLPQHSSGEGSDGGEIYDEFDKVCKGGNESGGGSGIGSSNAFDGYRIIVIDEGTKSTSSSSKAGGTFRVVSEKKNETDSDSSEKDYEPATQAAGQKGQGPKYWQTHAMKEVCLEAVKAEDDDLVEHIHNYRKKKGGLSEVDEKLIEKWCVKVGQCSNKGSGGGRSEL